MNNNLALIEIKELCKTYSIKSNNMFSKNEKLNAISDLSFNINKGEVFGLVGESGCGKSTTGQIIANCISASAGEVLYNGKDILKANRKEKKSLRKDIQIIFQDPYSSLNPKKKIGWTIEEPLVIHTKLSKSERLKLVDEMLEIVGLDKDYKDKYPNELSGGQRQRVSIATALMLNPEFVIADESVSALDVSIQSQILNLLKRLQADRNLTYLFISHDLNVVQYISDRIGVMYLGKLMEVGNVEDVYNNPMHPYTEVLLASIPSVGNKIINKVVLKGEIPNSINPPNGCSFHTRCPRAKEICKEKCPELRDFDNGRKVRCHFV